MKQRQRRALERLQAQLESGVKTKSGTTSKKIKLTSKDEKRISKEIVILESKLKIT
jgi:hypothetical protein